MESKRGDMYKATLRIPKKIKEKTMAKDLLSQQFKFVGRGNHEKLREFNQRINYVLRQMTREFEAMPKAVGELIAPPEAEIINNNNGMIEAAIIKYITYIPSDEPPREEKPRDTRERKDQPGALKMKIPDEVILKPEEEKKPAKKVLKSSKDPAK